MAAYRDLEKLKIEMAHLHGQIEDTGAAYKDAVVVSERLVVISWSVLRVVEFMHILFDLYSLKK